MSEGRPEIVLLISGKRKCGKDYLSERLLSKWVIIAKSILMASRLRMQTVECLPNDCWHLLIDRIKQIFLLPTQNRHWESRNNSHIWANQIALGQRKRIRLERIAQRWTIQRKVSQRDDHLERWCSAAWFGILLPSFHSKKYTHFVPLLLSILWFEIIHYCCISLLTIVLIILQAQNRLSLLVIFGEKRTFNSFAMKIITSKPFE